MELDTYLAHSSIIDRDHPSIRAKAGELAAGKNSDAAIAQACFEFVRDEIRHSIDHRLNPVTCRASDVLRHGTGFCYAKSHLLAALLRANGIPAGLCYQRLTIDDDKPPYSLHGLNAVFLRDFGWYRVDPRGNRADVDARFQPPVERLAFEIRLPGEADLPGIHAEPLTIVTEVLETATHWREVLENLPDLEPGSRTRE